MSRGDQSRDDSPLLISFLKLSVCFGVPRLSSHHMGQMDVSFPARCSAAGSLARLRTGFLTAKLQFAESILWVSSAIKIPCYTNILPERAERAETLLISTSRAEKEQVKPSQKNASFQALLAAVRGQIGARMKRLESPMEKVKKSDANYSAGSGWPKGQSPGSPSTCTPRGAQTVPGDLTEMLRQS